MMGGCNTKPHHGGTANGQRKEAGSPATAGQVVDRLDAGVSHTGGFQASAKCLEAKEIPALGPAPVALHPLADDLLLRRQPAREVRGGQGVLRGLLSQTKTSRNVLFGIREGHRQASHAHPAGVGGGDSRSRGKRSSAIDGKWGTLFPSAAMAHGRACPRTEELERRLGTFGKEGSSPMIWNTSIVHLTLGFPFCWRLGKGGKASERSHLIYMLRWLPAAALIVADAGYVGYEVVATMILAKVFFLIRMSSNATFYSEANEPLDEFREGIVYYWPKTQQNEGKPPIRGRLMRIHSGRHKVDVWLFTNVEDPQQLSLETAATCYRWRWENEGFFRTYKRTLKKVDADEPDGTAGASRGGSLHDRHAVVALPGCVGDACTAEGQPSGDVQSPRRAAGSASRHLGHARNPEAVWRKDCPGATRTACAHQSRNRNANGRVASHIRRRIRPFC